MRLSVMMAATGLVICGLPACTSAAEHPRLGFDAAGLAQLRATVAQTGPGLYGFAPAEGWAAVLAKAEALLARPTYSYKVQIPASNGEHAGWAWSYTLSDEAPPRHDESPHYPPWTAMFQERADSLSTRLKHFAFAYAITGEPRFAEAGKAIALHLAAWPTWTDPSYSNGNLTACLDTGHATQMVALLYDWCYDQLTESERATLRTALVERGILAIRAQLEKLDPYHNFWAVINTGLGTAALALLGEDDRAEGWVQESIANTVRQFDRQGADGGSYEGPMYGTYAADMLAQLIFCLDSAGVPHQLREHPFLATLPRFVINGMSPDVKGQPTFGDGGWGAAYSLTMAMLAAAGDEAARWYLVESGQLSGMATLNELLFQAPLLQATVPPAPPAWRGDDVFADIGYAFLRDDQAGGPFLAFKCGPPTEKVGHNHYDQNSFQITGLGQVLAADPGYRSYFDPPKRRFTVGTLGHSTLIVGLDDDYLASEAVTSAGHDQVNLAGGQITEFVPSEGIGLVTGEAAAAYNPADQTVLSQFRRRIAQLPGVGYLMIDDVAAPEPAALSWMLHGTGGAFADAAGSRGLIGLARARLQADLLTPGGVSWFAGEYPGAESYGPYLAATAAPATERRFVSVLVPRRLAGVLVANGGFERELLGWTIRDQDGQGPNHTVSTEQPYEGEYCGRIDQAGYLYSNRFTLPAGSEITARCRYRTAGATRGASFTIYFWPSAGSATSRQVSDLVSEDGWSEAVIEATVPDNAATISVAFNYFDTGTGFVDAVEVTSDQPVENDAPAAVTPLGDGASDGLEIEVDGRRYLVAFGNAGRLASDGELALAAFDTAGALTDLLLLKGTRLDLDGQPTLRTRRAVTVSAHRGPDGWSTTLRDALQPHAPALEAGEVGLELPQG